MSSSSRNERGFTLIEVLISILLVAFISLMIYQVTTKSYELRTKLLDSSNFYSEIRLSMGILQRDIALVYNPLLMAPEEKSKPKGGAQSSGADVGDEAFGRSNAWWGAPIDQLGIRPARFVGTETKITMITVSNIRMYKESPESEFMKVSYELTDDPSPDAGGTKVLTKMASPNAFDDDDAKDKYWKTYPLLHGIELLSFRYFQKEKQKWATSWDSDSSDFKNEYPDLVEVTLRAKGPSRQVFDAVYNLRPETFLRGVDPIF